MTITPNLTAFTVTPSSGVNGAVNAYNISVTSPIPQINTDQLVFTFPSTITPSSTASPLCSTIANITAVTCTLSGNTITASFTFSGGTLAAGSPFDFYVNGVTNPPST